MSYYHLTPHRRRAATRLEPDWLQRGLGLGLFVLLVIGACWAVP